MNVGKLVFAQVTQHLPLTTFRRCVARYDGEHKVKAFSCPELWLAPVRTFTILIQRPCGRTDSRFRGSG